MSTAIRNLAAPKNKRGKNDRRAFTWKCWLNGQLVNVVVEPPIREEKNIIQGGVRGRLYQREGESLKTTPGVIHQDADGRTYFVPNN